jgi:heat-inducible transcriptional repressor
LRLFVDGLLEIGALSQEERSNRSTVNARRRAAASPRSAGTSDHDAVRACRAARAWSMAPKTDAALKHIEFVQLGPGRALVGHGDRERAWSRTASSTLPIGMPAVEPD